MAILLDDLAADPAWFPERLDWENGLIRLVRVAHGTLLDSAFLDGRTPLAAFPDDAVVVDLRDFAGQFDERPAMRWIFHEGFCGSTLLARIVTVEGHALCLREPQVLVDLANWRLALAGERPAFFAQAGDAILAKLGQRWSVRERIAIKPSNWVNTILADLWMPQQGDRAVIVRSAPEAFLLAILRGGRDRIVYVLNLYRQLATARPDLARRAEARMRASSDPIARALQVVALFYWVQERMLEEACTRSGATLAEASLEFPDLLHDLPRTADRVARRLGLDIAPEALARSLSRNGSRHSKADSRAYVAGEEDRANQVLGREHGAEIDICLAILRELAAPEG